MRLFFVLWMRHDYVAFYVTSPLKKIIGFVIIEEKFIEEEIFWPLEKFFDKPLWKYRFRFKPIHIIKNWDKGISPSTNMMLNQERKVIAKKIF